MKKSVQFTPRMYRQGDVLLIAVPSLPTTVTVRERDRAVLALGEVTGHSHTITMPDVIHYDAPDAATAAQQLLASVGLTIEVGDANAPSFLTVPDGATVEHQEHHAHVLPAGHYVKLIQTTWSDALEPIKVAD